MENTPKESFERVRSKMFRKKKNFSTHSLLGQGLGNRNAQKTTRRLELGWMHYDKSNNCYKQIRNKRGGGTRHLSVDRDMKLVDILETAKSLFFPEGYSQIGSVDELLFELRDFQGRNVKDVSVEDAYIETRLKILRLYIYTKEKVANKDGENGLKPQSDPDSDFEMLGTPTILKKKSRLRLKKPTCTVTFESTEEATVSVPNTNTLNSSPTITASFSANTDSTTIERSSTIASSPIFDNDNSNHIHFSTNTSSSVITTALENTYTDRSSTIESSSTSDIAGLYCFPTTKSSCTTIVHSNSIDRSPIITPSSAIDSATSCSSTITTLTTNASDSTSTDFLSMDITSSVTSIGNIIPLFPETDDLPDIPLSCDVASGYIDEDLQAAIDASMKDASMKEKVENPCMEEILRSWVSTNLQDDESSYAEIVIHRRKILESTTRAVSRLSFSFNKPVKVKFPGEPGEDLGGPKREYFRLLMSEIQSNILEGKPGNLTFQHSLRKLETNAFMRAGQYVAWSLLQGGPGLPVFNNTIYNLILGQTDIDVTMDDVVDEDTKANVLKIKNAQTVADLDSLGDWMLDQGFPVLTQFNDKKREELVDLSIKHYVFYRIHAEISQFREGLASVGNLLELLKKYPKEMSSLFIYEEHPLTPEKMQTLLKINYSPLGSSNRLLEDDTIYAFELFLQDCTTTSSNIQLSDILSFWTGANRIPPMGFQKSLEINFVPSNRLPVARTCDLALELSRGEDPDDFQRKFQKALTWGGGFHLPLMIVPSRFLCFSLSGALTTK